MHLNTIIFLSLSFLLFGSAHLLSPLFFFSHTAQPNLAFPSPSFPPCSLAQLAFFPSSPSITRGLLAPSLAQRPACASSLSPPSSHADRRGPPVRVVPDLQHESGLDSHPSLAASRPFPVVRSPRPACQGPRLPYKTPPRALGPDKPAAAASRPRSPSRCRY
jgi:hypothetical protein